MSRIKELKQKYPTLALSILDLLSMVDPTSNNKYLGLLAQITDQHLTKRLERDSIEEFQQVAIRNGYPEPIAMSSPGDQLYLMYCLDNIVTQDNIRLMNEFMTLNERGVIVQNDILKYKNIQQIQEAISLAQMRLVDKDMEGQIIRVFEDNKWLILRPLTFASSCKYGAATKWCTTATTSPEHFYRYWSRGALIYILNKETGYKVAAQKYYDEDDRSTLWNAADREVNWADVDVETNIFEIVKNEIALKVTNKSLCNTELQEKVHFECYGRPSRMFSAEGIVPINPNHIYHHVEVPQTNIQADLIRALEGFMQRDIVEAVDEPTMEAEPEPQIEESQPVLASSLGDLLSRIRG